MSDTAVAGERVELAADFVARFADFWSAPAPGRLDALLAPEVRLVAPLTPTTRTLADGKRAFASLLRLSPDLTAEVHSWGATPAGVMIDFTLNGSVSGVGLRWRAVDRIALRDDGLASERVSHFDSLPLLLTALRHPRTWPRFLYSQAKRLG
ncbi:MAG TPA: nuclear transport factor 2 family protein [Solirubrobacterales bacterium]|nr:nuclear transport factor 2 family protein [Solirubrobacterales bacterium]